MTTLNEFAATVRGRRQDLSLSQAALAAKAGVSRKWIYEFEAGKSTAELGLVLRVLDALDIEIDLVPRGEPARASDAGAALEKALARTRTGQPRGLETTGRAISQISKQQTGIREPMAGIEGLSGKAGASKALADLAKESAGIVGSGLPGARAAADELARLHTRPSAVASLSRLNSPTAGRPSPVVGRPAAKKAKRKMQP